MRIRYNNPQCPHYIFAKLLRNRTNGQTLKRSILRKLKEILMILTYFSSKNLSLSRKVPAAPYSITVESISCFDHNHVHTPLKLWFSTSIARQGDWFQENVIFKGKCSHLNLNYYTRYPDSWTALFNHVTISFLLHCLLYTDHLLDIPSMCNV